VTPPRRRPVRGVRVLLGALLLALALVGCGALEPVGADGPGTGGAPGGVPTDGTTERPTAIDPGLVECGTAEDAREVPDDLSRVRWEVPAGFREATGYTQVNAAEGPHEATYLALVGAGLDLLAIVRYPQLEHGRVVDSCGRLDRTAVVERVAAHTTASGAVTTVEPQWETVAGASVLVEERAYPEHDFAVRNLWIYGTTELVHVTCQWRDHEQRVRDACAELVGSLALG
jgi:hypothetical protein